LSCETGRGKDKEDLYGKMDSWKITSLEIKEECV
jgi:hypothetical protein